MPRRAADMCRASRWCSIQSRQLRESRWLAASGGVLNAGYGEVAMRLVQQGRTLAVPLVRL